ncbi:glycine zipper 2TM domain-containing protein [Massilia aerilata]|uniref:Glycine zipper 2TM domain-containing protein n=1 Tax=Massilia aerilata TaxID=453817 RepID=A0ABW0RYX1_9BURK
MATTRQTLAAAVVAALPLFAATVPAPVQAQEHPRARQMEPRIEGFNVNELRRIEPGAELNFEVFGTPGGNASVRIDGATRNLHLNETRPGTYSGTYTIGRHDRIRPDSAVTANLRVNGMVKTQALAATIVRVPERVSPADRAMAGTPRVQSFDVRGSDDLGPGHELRFTVAGTPGARVEVQIAGTSGIFTLPEVRPGEYDGVYTIRRGDNIAPDASVTATIKSNGRYSTATLGQPLLAGGRGDRMDERRDARRDDRRADDSQRVARYCTNCATVESVNVIQGDAGAAGTLGGAAVGGLLGNQVGSGSGRTAATVAGAVGGAIAGRAIERNARAPRYEVVVRYENGTTQAIRYDNDPGFRVGEQVKVADGVLTRD